MQRSSLIQQFRPFYQQMKVFFSSATLPYNKVEIIYSKLHDIHFNLAIEEQLYEHEQLKNPILFLWRNDKTIVIGRHQNPWKECFLQNMEKDQIKLSRRRTGGGAVYQDLGNTCFSFLTPIYDKSFPLDSKNINNKILISALKNLGIQAEFSGRNDILCQGKKISGSAYKVNLGKTDGSGKKALHHGTMLINVNSQNLKNYLNPNKEKLKSKGVDSVISRVVNLKEIYPDITHELFCKEVENEFIKHYSNCSSKVTHLDSVNNPHVDKIFNELRSWDWLYGNTPNFTNELEKRFDWGIVDIFFQVENNMIISGKIYSDCLFADFITQMNELLNSKKYPYSGYGVKRFCQDLRTNEQNKDFSKFIEDIESWLINAI